MTERGEFFVTFSVWCEIVIAMKWSPPQPKNLHFFRTEQLQSKSESPAVSSDVGVINSDKDNHDGEKYGCASHTADLKKCTVCK